MTLKLKTSTCGIGCPSPRVIARLHPDVYPKVAALGVNEVIFDWEDIFIIWLLSLTRKMVEGPHIFV